VTISVVSKTLLFHHTKDISSGRGVHAEPYLSCLASLFLSMQGGGGLARTLCRRRRGDRDPSIAFIDLSVLGIVMR
jgi:hypothetical protein